MTTNTTQQITSETHPLTVDEGWDLIFSLFGSAKELYAKAGGAEGRVAHLNLGAPSKLRLGGLRPNRLSSPQLVYLSEIHTDKPGILVSANRYT